jgi:hypothetical protein
MPGQAGVKLGACSSRSTGADGETVQMRSSPAQLKNRRAGVPPTSDQMRELLQTIKAAHGVDIFGFYSRALHVALDETQRADMQTSDIRTAPTRSTRRQITSRPRWTAQIPPRSLRGSWALMGIGY